MKQQYRYGLPKWKGYLVYVDQGRIKKSTEATENDNSNTEEVESKMMADTVKLVKVLMVLWKMKEL